MTATNDSKPVTGPSPDVTRAQIRRNIQLMAAGRLRLRPEDRISTPTYPVRNAKRRAAIYKRANLACEECARAGRLRTCGRQAEDCVLLSAIGGAWGRLLVAANCREPRASLCTLLEG